MITIKTKNYSDMNKHAISSLYGILKGINDSPTLNYALKGTSTGNLLQNVEGLANAAELDTPYNIKELSSEVQKDLNLATENISSFSDLDKDMPSVRKMLCKYSRASGSLSGPMDPKFVEIVEELEQLPYARNILYEARKGKGTIFGTPKSSGSKIDIMIYTEFFKWLPAKLDELHNKLSRVSGGTAC
jgi:hypothetical protein